MGGFAELSIFRSFRFLRKKSSRGAAAQNFHAYHLARGISLAVPPAGLTLVVGFCLAPAGYEGICSPAMDFSTVSTSKKASWASRCDATWPCINDGSKNAREVGPRNGP